MAESKVTYKELRNATVHIDNSVDVERTYDISSDVTIQGQNVVESFQNGIVNKDGAQIASFNCWGDETNIGINYSGVLSENQCSVLESVISFMKNVKAKIESSEEPVLPGTISEKEVVNQQLMLTRMMINTMVLTDEQAIEVKDLYPLWEDLIGITISEGFRLNYNGTLYKALQEHQVQEQWKPGIDTASIYAIVSESVSEEHAGTKEDPIPYVQNMPLEQGKFYTQEGVLYECIQTTVTGYPNNLKDLVSIVKEVTEEENL